jgi:hypothetical protein
VSKGKQTMDYNLSKNLENLKEILDNLETIPHGSGIDFTWQISNSATRLLLSNAYHCMDENGYYVSSVPFTITIPLDNPTEFKIQFNDYIYYGYHIQLLKNNGTLDYLKDIIGYWIDSMSLYNLDNKPLTPFFT